MSKYILILISIMLMSSCVTQKKCLEKYPPTVDTIKIVTIRDSIVYKDKLVPVYLAGETRIDSIKIPCPEPPKSFIPDTARAETKFAIAKAWFKFPNIQIKLEQPDTTINVLLENAVKEAYYWKSEYEKVTVTPQPIKYIPTIYKIAFWLWIGVIIGVLGFFGIKILLK